MEVFHYTYKQYILLSKITRRGGKSVDARRFSPWFPRRNSSRPR